MAGPPRGRGRPRAFDRDDALEKATNLFWAKGYEATSIADLTAAMGIGAPSLYAAFGSKEGLYAEALRYYGDRYECVVWSGFRAAPTAREAVAALLKDSATALTQGSRPAGCMVTLSSVGSEGHAELGQMVNSARNVSYERLEERFTAAVAAGEIPGDVDTRALARFIQTVHSGMSILARDGAGRAELDAVAEVALAGWDARVAGR